MTRNEALRVFHHLPFYDTYVTGGRLDDVESTFDFEEMINYFMSLDISVEDAIKFVEGNVDFATMDNERTRDDHDNLDYSTKNGLSSWTEVLGNVYYLKDMNIKWKDYEPSEEEILEQQRWDEERAKHFKEMISKLVDVAIPNMMDAELVEVHPMNPMKDEVRKNLEKIVKEETGE